jgi:hypothetical protein
MNRLRHARAAWGLVAALAISTMLGCGSDGGLATVEGHVTKNGAPMDNHWVRFTPVGGGRSGNGRTDKDGRYELAYTYDKKGARVGANLVEVGTGGEIDSRGSEISAPVKVFSVEKVVEDGDNVIDLEIAGGETE